MSDKSFPATILTLLSKAFCSPAILLIVKLSKVSLLVSIKSTTSCNVSKFTLSDVNSVFILSINPFSTLPWFADNGTFVLLSITLSTISA